MLWILVLGIATGMRTMTGIAVVCWYAWLGMFILHNTRAEWAANLVSVMVFTVLALGEYYGDTLPTTPSRKKLPLVLARVVFGGLVGAIAAKAMGEPGAGGVILGVSGALIGTYGGYSFRMRMAKGFGRDLPAALTESAVALLLAVGAAYRIHLDAVALLKVEGGRTFF